MARNPKQMPSPMNYPPMAQPPMQGPMQGLVQGPMQPIYPSPMQPMQPMQPMPGMMPSPMQGVMPRPLQPMPGMMPGPRPPMQAGYRRPPMAMPVVEPKRPKMTNMDRVQQDNDQKMIESLLSRWYEVRKAGIEVGVGKRGLGVVDRETNQRERDAAEEDSRRNDSAAAGDAKDRRTTHSGQKQS